MVEEVVNASADTILGNIIVEVGELGLLMKGIGILSVLLIIFYIISLINDWRRIRELVRIRERMERVERKIDKLIRMK